MEFRLLGPVEVVHEGNQVAVGGRQRRALLALLLVHANETVSADYLIDQIWGDQPPPAARKSLQSHVAHLRRVVNVEGEWLRARPPGYALSVDIGRLDVLRFQDSLDRGRARLAGDPKQALTDLEEALRLWRGEPLADVADEAPSLRAEVGRLAELRLDAVEQRVEAELALRHHDRLVAELERMTENNPLRERLWAWLMLALYRSGRQADALAAYQRIRRLLAEELGIEPSTELQDLEEKILLHAPELDWTPPRQAPATHQRRPESEPPSEVSHVPTNLPLAVSSFIGREDEAEEVARLISEARLVTLTGAGGSGKTRLALEVARGALANFPDGVWFVGLASSNDPDLVASEVAAAMRLPERADRAWVEALRDALAGRAPLLLVDNCEHLVEAVASLTSSLLETAPDMKVLATSRQPLGIPGEVTFQVPLLTIPPTSSAGSLGELSHFEAARLFIERARSARPNLTLSGAHAPAIAAICRRLDGLPLALELAAARVRAFTPAEIVEALDDRFAVLGDIRRGSLSRHQTLEAAVAWSYELLREEERRMFRRLSVFAGGFDREAAYDVAEGDMTGLASLVDQSLVVAEASPSGSRYRLLETMAAFGQRLLGEEEKATRDAHLAWVTKLARRAAANLEGKHQAEWIARVETELDNVRAAMIWALGEGDLASGMAVASSLLNYWYMRGVREGSRWIEQLLASPGHVSDEVKAWTLFTGGALIHQHGEHENQRAAPLLEASLELFRALDDQLGMAYALHHLSRLHWGEVELERLRNELGDVLAGFRQVGDQVGVATSLLFLIWFELEYGDPAGSVAVAEELLPLADRIGSPNIRAHAKELAATATWRGGDLSSPKPLLHEAIELYRQVANTQCSAHCLESVAAWLVGTGDAERAGLVLSATEALRSQIGVHAPRWERSIPEAARADIESALGEEEFPVTWQRGKALDFEEALDLALAATR